MPIPNPILDDRSYQQLRDELVRRIPVYTPEWTDHNASDPGITLIELFSFLGENLLFRFNQIPEATKLAFLRLLQVPLRPAVAARALITMSADVPQGLLVPQGAAAKAGNLQFETVTEVKAYPVKLTAVGRISSPTPDKVQDPEGYDFAVRALDAIGPLPVDQKPVYYHNEIVPPDGGGLPVDFSATVDGMLWMAVLSTKDKDVEIQKNKKDLGKAVLNIGFIPDLIVPSIDEVIVCPGARVAPNDPAVEWQASTGKIDKNTGQPTYLKLTVVGDTTRGLNQEGIVRLRLPNALVEQDGVTPILGNFNSPDIDIDKRGTGQFPPLLDDETENKILFWIRAFRLNKSRIGKMQFIGINATEVVQTTRAVAEFLGVGNAQANQRFKLVHRPVLEESLVIEVEEGNRFVPWKTVDGFFASTPDDRHFIVDLEAGEVRFGNGIQGYCPQIGQRIRALEYRYGGGSAGNVPSKAINKISDFAVKDVQNPLRAYGGGDSETIDAALVRIPGELRRHDRTVTSGDFQELALATPGANIGRAECLPRFYPPTRTTERAGVVSVVVWPKDDPSHPNAPLPDRNLLRDVCAYLDQRRLVTTELYVIPPTYHKVAVSVGVHVKPGFGVEAVRQWVELVLRQYLAPLPPYGPTGQGWPLGRRVHGPELEAAALQVEGVEFLEGLEVIGFNEQTQVWTQGTVLLAIYEVPELTEITVVEGTPLPAGQTIVPPPGKTPVPIPTIRQEC
ncbi:putative baseplate assembly protein [Methyloglobulus sp.]|uniref:putative baseplate assembly protein n=1 Tax=Methyloglobulus sp. TaxID=2518622 RepID=UPI0032B77F87